ncbi:MAG: hypothetical protein ABFR62_10875 [Bacteroidota bacterium]
MIKKIIAVIVLILIAFFAFLYLGNYSEGTQAGVIMKIQKKGVVFKTWEGRLDMGTVGKSKSANLGSKIFEFSINGKDEELLRKLQEAQLSGERVNLFFEQKYMKILWDGDTKYFATGVESSNEVPEEKENKLPQLGN